MLLPREDAAQFFRLMWGLQFFVSQQRQLFPDVQSVEEYTTLPGTQKIIARDALWAHPDLIDAYVEKNPDHLSPEEQAIVRQWKRFVAGRFTIFRYLKDHAIFIRDSTVYGVLGLYDRFEELYPGRPLPVLVETVLLPYKGKIVYDGLLRGYNIYFGAGFRRGLNETYMTAKQNGRIITSLEPEAAPAQPARRPHGLDAESQAVLAELVKTSERLRGGTAVQSAALGLLRASARVAHSAAEKPDDLDELWRSGQQAQNALNRFQKVLERAKQ